MKSTGMVRKMDTLGRVVLPIEMRRVLGIGEHDPLEISIDGSKVILKKYKHACILCGKANNQIVLKDFCGKPVCNDCINRIKSEL